MTTFQFNHLLTGAELTPQEMHALLASAKAFKQARAQGQATPYLPGKHLALLFSKPSLRTRFSFTVAMRELGGDVIESLSDTRKAEEPEDQARVLAGYCHAVMVRTHEDDNLQRMANMSSIPVINGLSNGFHPCQALTDIFTLQEIFGDLRGLNFTYIGDGNNVLQSLLLTAPALGINVNYCCPAMRQPNLKVVNLAKQRAELGGASVIAHHSPQQAVKNTHAVYTDVWASMGFEDQVSMQDFAGFQVNEALMQLADKDAVFMHCLPMLRGKEVSETLPDQKCSVIFQQSENRMHLQKALLFGMLGKNMNVEVVMSAFAGMTMNKRSHLSS